jgi:CBS domain containing-hemolysin-like protein
LDILPALGVFLASIVLRGLFSGYETGFVSTNPIRIRFLAHQKDLTQARRLMQHLGKPDEMLSLLLVGTNIMTIVGTMAIVRAAGGFTDVYEELIATLVVTPVMVVFSEFIPKSVFRAHPNRLVLALLPVIRFFYWLLAPLALPTAWLTRLLFTERHYLDPLMSTREDVRVLVDESADHGTIEPEEQQMIHSVINLQRTQAKEIMVPRIDIQALPDTATRSELLTQFEETGRTRIPVYRETIDTVTGIVNAHDVLLDTEPGNQDISRFVREVIHVPDTVKVDDLFELLKETKKHIAIVTDEYGGTDGLITIEDILEQIFGEIQDEHDSEDRPIVRVGPHAYVIDARVPLEDVVEAIGASIQDDEVETVAGWLMHVAGRIPAVGEAIDHDRFRMTVLSGGPQSISKIRLEVLAEDQNGDVAHEGD